MNAAAQPAPEEQPKQPTPAELAAQARQFYENEWNSVADKERARIGLAKGTIKKNETLTPAELRDRVPLPGDTMQYAKGKDGKPRIATNKFGLPAWPKQNGRRKPHMAKNSHGIKSASIRIFRDLFSIHAQAAQIKAKSEGVDYPGVPTDEISKIGARAGVLGARQFKAAVKANKRRAGRRQDLSRRINYGLVPRNTNVRAYIG